MAIYKAYIVFGLGITLSLIGVFSIMYAQQQMKAAIRLMQQANQSFDDFIDALENDDGYEENEAGRRSTDDPR